jgi:hypothetical protein
MHVRVRSLYQRKQTLLAPHNKLKNSAFHWEVNIPNGHSKSSISASRVLVFVILSLLERL